MKKILSMLNEFFSKYWFRLQRWTSNGMPFSFLYYKYISEIFRTCKKWHKHLMMSEGWKMANYHWYHRTGQCHQKKNNYSLICCYSHCKADAFMKYDRNNKYWKQKFIFKITLYTISEHFIKFEEISQS